MRYLTYFLNLPWTLIGLLNALIAVPIKMEFRNDAIIFHTKTVGLVALYQPKGAGVALGNVVIVKRDLAIKILDHELVHIEQFMREPFIHPFLYSIELLRKGYFNNKYEFEAYERTDSWPDYIKKDKENFLKNSKVIRIK